MANVDSVNLAGAPFRHGKCDRTGNLWYTKRGCPFLPLLVPGSLLRLKRSF
jgi:hypothetical protein